MRPPRTAEVVFCFDCGYVGNRPEVVENYQEFMEGPWTAMFCPECGEHAGPWVPVVEVMEDT